MRTLLSFVVAALAITLSASAAPGTQRDVRVVGQANWETLNGCLRTYASVSGFLTSSATQNRGGRAGSSSTFIRLSGGVVDRCDDRALEYYDVVVSPPDAVVSASPAPLAEMRVATSLTASDLVTGGTHSIVVDITLTATGKPTSLRWQHREKGPDLTSSARIVYEARDAIVDGVVEIDGRALVAEEASADLSEEASRFQGLAATPAAIIADDDDVAFVEYQSPRDACVVRDTLVRVETQAAAAPSVSFSSQLWDRCSQRRLDAVSGAGPLSESAFEPNGRVHIAAAFDADHAGVALPVVLDLWLDPKGRPATTWTREVFRGPEGRSSIRVSERSWQGGSLVPEEDRALDVAGTIELGGMPLDTGAAAWAGVQLIRTATTG